MKEIGLTKSELSEVIEILTMYNNSINSIFTDCEQSQADKEYQERLENIIIKLNIARKD